MNKLFKSIIEKKLGILIVTLILFLFVYISGIGFTTMDDAMFGIHVMNNKLPGQQVIDWAFNQGRFQYFLISPLMALPHLIQNNIYYNFFTVFGLLSVFFSFSFFIGYFLRNRLIGFLTAIYLLSIYQNGWGHNLVTSYSFYIWFSLVTFIISIIILDKLINNYNKKLLFLYLILVFYSLTSESNVLFFILFTFFIIYKNRFLIKKDKIKSLVLIYFPLIIYLGIYFSFKIYTSSEQIYSGTKINFDILAIWKTMWQYTAGGFPGYYFFDGTYSNIISKYQADYPFNKFDLFLVAVGVNGFIKIASIIFGTYVVSNNLRQESTLMTSRQNLTILGFLFLSFIFAANFLQALTPKYQEWVLKFNDPSYVGSSFSTVGFIILFVIILNVITRINKESLYKKVLTFYIICIVCLSLATSYTNFYLKLDQAQSILKWTLVDKMIHSEPFRSIPSQSNISASSLFSVVHGIMHTDEVYWTSYINLNTIHGRDFKGINIKNTESIENRFYMKYSEQVTLGLNSCLFLGDNLNNTIYAYFSNSIENYQLLGKTQKNATIEVFKNEELLFATKTYDGIFNVDNINIGKNDILKIKSSSNIIEESLFFNNSTAKINLSDIKYNFEKGFYSDEITHRWSGPENNSIVEIINSSEEVTSMVIRLSLYALKKKRIKIYQNDLLLEEVQIDKENIKYDIVLNNIIFKKGVNYLKFENLDGTESPDGSNDNRKLGFAISNLIILKEGK
jgi:hypothetical protein